MNRPYPVGISVAPPPDPGSRPTILDYFLLLIGCALSFYLIRIGDPPVVPGASETKPAIRYVGHLRIEPGPRAWFPPLQYLVRTLPDLLRIQEGILLLWPLFFGIQRTMGRNVALTSGEWLWVFAWLGTAALNALAGGNRWGMLPAFMVGWASWLPVIWYFFLAPSMALIAAFVVVLGLIRGPRLPWTHTFGLALVIWPALPLTAILLLGNNSWSSSGS
jgi:hypothetical protein